MHASIGNHIRSNVVGYVALFAALSGTAWAANGPLAGRNTVGSADIINGEVKGKDIADGAVDSAKVLNESLTGDDVLGIGGADISDNTLTGNDISESSLGLVPSALLGGLGRSGRGAVNCDPDSTTFVTCVSVGPIYLPTQTRVLLIGALRAGSEVNARGLGNCRLGTSATGGLAGTGVLVDAAPDEIGDGYSLTAVTPLLGPGPISFGIDCNESLASLPIVYNDVMLSAVLLSPS